ncbi:hypothetical protein K438DRAFT_1761059 [Mycena galopus ATCC 62051]|nr:hypothetical protein K438DRAFT_1761059 [Mycena galopus ATCC 62051]
MSEVTCLSFPDASRFLNSYFVWSPASNQARVGLVAGRFRDVCLVFHYTFRSTVESNVSQRTILSADPRPRENDGDILEFSGHQADRGAATRDEAGASKIFGAEF